MTHLITNDLFNFILYFKNTTFHSFTRQVMGKKNVDAMYQLHAQKK